MPHLIASTIELQPEKSRAEEHSVRFISHCARRALVCIEDAGEELLLEVKQKQQGGFIIKHDKLTRPADLERAKRTLTKTALALNAQVTFSNLAQKNSSVSASHLLSPFEFCKGLECFKERAVILEIGFGSGRHLMHLAQENHDAIVLGVEIYQPAIAQVLGAISRNNIENLYVVQYDARILLELLPQGRLDAIFVHFPVPWNESPCRRVFGERFLKAAVAALNADGFVELRTDDREYFDDAVKLCEPFGDCTLQTAVNAAARIKSKYEERWLRKGKDIFDLVLYAPKNKSALKSSERSEFIFDRSVSFDVVRQKLDTKLLSSDEVIVRIEEFYEDENGGLVRLTMGMGSWTQRLYLRAEGNSLAYFPAQPLCSVENRAAHQLICERLYGTDS